MLSKVLIPKVSLIVLDDGFNKAFNMSMDKSGKKF